MAVHDVPCTFVVQLSKNCNLFAHIVCEWCFCRFSWWVLAGYWTARLGLVALLLLLVFYESECVSAVSKAQRSGLCRGIDGSDFSCSCDILCFLRTLKFTDAIRKWCVGAKNILIDSTNWGFKSWSEAAVAGQLYKSEDKLEVIINVQYRTYCTQSATSRESEDFGFSRIS